jgi:hypothetical protein
LSGSKLTINEAIKAGPGVNQQGASVFFNGNNFVTVDHYEKWDTTEMRINFWIYIIDGSNDPESKLYCPILLKGHDDFATGSFVRYPAIFLHETQRKIRAYISLANKDKYKDVRRRV